MTKNLTLAIDEELLKKAKKAAIDKNTTITALIRKHLEYISQQQEHKKQSVINELRSIYHKSKAKIGPKKWTREELHER